MMESMARVEVEAVVATSHPLQAYGGVQIDDGALQQIADNGEGLACYAPGD